MQDYRTSLFYDTLCGVKQNFWHKLRMRCILIRMDSLAPTPPPVSTWSPHLPAWTVLRTHDIAESDAAFSAGIALKSLDDLLRTNLLWLGCWRDHLALTSATVAAKMLGCREDEHAIRDAVLLRAFGDDPGPAGKLFLATRLLSRGSGSITTAGTVKLKNYGQSWHSPLPLTQPAGARTHSTFAWRRFSVHGDGGTGYRGVECGRDLRPGHGWRRNAGDVELI